MFGLLTLLKRPVQRWSRHVYHRLLQWMRPTRHSLRAGTFSDMTRTKSDLIAENARDNESKFGSLYARVASGSRSLILPATVLPGEARDGPILAPGQNSAVLWRPQVAVSGTLRDEHKHKEFPRLFSLSSPDLRSSQKACSAPTLKNYSAEGDEPSPGLR